MTYAAILFLFGFIMPGVDNFAHLGGFLGGYAAATVLNPLEPERSGHFLGAVLCFACTALAILASLLQGVAF